jgi:hypothetical protein
VKLGFLPRSLDIAAGNFSIATIADWKQLRAEMEANGHVADGWLYKPRKHSSPEPIGRFELPETHEIVSVQYGDDTALMQFVVIVLGFLFGLRLLPEGWGHLHGVAIESGKCNGFIVPNREIIPCLELAAQFYTTNKQTRNVKRLQAAISLIHWSKGQEQHFDTFNYLYMAIDACWAACSELHASHIRQMHSKGPVPHSLRPAIMQQILGLQLPTIFDPYATVTAASIRNDLIHEGLVGDMPLGLSIMEPHCDIEMREFADKIILALMGVKAGYLATPGGDRQRHMLDLK